SVSRRPTHTRRPCLTVASPSPSHPNITCMSCTDPRHVCVNISRTGTVLTASILSPLSACFFFQAEDGIRDRNVTGVQTCALPIWGAIPDDHPLMIGMVGLQTSHQYGNASFLESDFVFGIGNRWANRHTGNIDSYREGRTFIHVDIEPTQIGRVFAPDLGIV